MPWKETCAVEERMEFIMKWREDEETVAALCRSFGVSRETGYKWVRRYESGGLAGLQDRSRVPHHSPHAVLASIEEPGTTPNRCASCHKAMLLRVEDHFR